MVDLENEWLYRVKIGDTVILAIEELTFTGEVVGLDLNGVKVKKNEQCSEYYPWKYVIATTHKPEPEYVTRKRTWDLLQHFLSISNTRVCHVMYKLLMMVLVENKNFSDKEFYDTLYGDLNKPRKITQCLQCLYLHSTKE